MGVSFTSGSFRLLFLSVFTLSWRMFEHGSNHLLTWAIGLRDYGCKKAILEAGIGTVYPNLKNVRGANMNDMFSSFICA